MIDGDSSLRNAAILLATLDAPTADSLLRQMEPEQSARLRSAMAALGDIDPDEQARVAAEFFRAAPRAADADGVELHESLASQFVDDTGYPPQLDDEMAHFGVSPQSLAAVNDREQAFGFLFEPQAADLAHLLEHEQPQTIALVVSHLPADRAAEVIAQLPGDVQADVLRRLVTLDETSPDVLHEVERSLESRVVARARLLERRAAGLSAVNNILAAADPTTKQLLRQHVADHDAALSRSLSQTPLLFSDLVLLDDKALWNLFGAAEQEWVLLAMAGASPALAERVMNLLPASEAKDFRRALADLGPTRLSDVEEAQHRIAELACRMELEGDLHMPPCRLGAMAA